MEGKKKNMKKIKEKEFRISEINYQSKKRRFSWDAQLLNFMPFIIFVFAIFLGSTSDLSFFYLKHISSGNDFIIVYTSAILLQKKQGSCCALECALVNGQHLQKWNKAETKQRHRSQDPIFLLFSNSESFECYLW